MTSTTYSFSAAASYSLTSRIKLFTWEIYDSEGVKLDTLQGKEIKKQFKKPGNYTVKLTVEDEIGNKNLDTVNVYVESTPPVPQFTITPTSLREYPSEFEEAVAIQIFKAFEGLEVKRAREDTPYRASLTNGCMGYWRGISVADSGNPIKDSRDPRSKMFYDKYKNNNYI